jgi:acetolactate synthase-1/2/3 large subunit
MADVSEINLGTGRLSRAEYGSDVVIEMLRLLEVPYVALNPGASFRGIHDSLVNFPGDGPEMVVCLHEEIAVAVALGYARATGRPMVAATHNLVGLQHASMAIYNAWCERLPVIVIGGTGPVAAEKRRNWIDWVHTALVQGNQVRDYVKWDDQPGSVADFPASLLRAHRIAMTEPNGPVYVCYDVGLQEQAIDGALPLPDVSRFRPPLPVAPDPEALADATRLLAAAEWPVIIADATGRHPEALPSLLALAEMLRAPVVSIGADNIATNPPPNAGALRSEVLGRADVVLALDVADLAGALGSGVAAEYDPAQFIRPDTKVIHISVWDLLQHSWAGDFERLQPVDVPITAATRLALPQLVAQCREAMTRDAGSAGRVDGRRRSIEELQAEASERRKAALRRNWDNRPISADRLYGELWQVVKDLPWTLVSSGQGGRGGWDITQPEQLVAPGGAGGGGLGSSTGAGIGASLALKGSGRLCINIQGDGDFLYAPSSLWTAANQRLPLLTIVNNNRSYGNDEGHQEHMARTRGRPIENRGIGIYIEEPAPDFAKLASGFDVEGFGAIEDPQALRGVFERAVQIVMREQRPVLVDVLTERPNRWR